ncbi:MAG TPA: acetolactate decarboxylase, partial [Weissella confusa]|nr:acetolactate decarboxylase [Weissella confusa]
MAVVFQHSTLAALMAGLLGGTMRAGDLLEHGDTG